MKAESDSWSRPCPRCGSQDTRRSLRHGFIETVVYRILQVHMYRCRDCDWRFTGRGKGRGHTDKGGDTL